MTMEDREVSTLDAGAWLPPIREALMKLVADHGIDSPSYDPQRPPLAVIDCDDTLIHNDLAEALMRHMITRRKLKTDRGFWQVVPERLGRDALAAAYRAVAGRNDNEVTGTAAFRRYRAGMLNAFETIRANEGLEAAYLFAGRMMRGQHERTVAEIVDEVLDIEFNRSLGMDDIPHGPPFPGVNVPTGLRVHMEILQLLQLLETYGFDTWLMSSAEVHIVRALARRLGVADDHVCGLEFQTQSGCLTDRFVDPVPVGEGKLEIFLDTVGRSPVLMVGNDMSGFELMENCEGLSVVIGNDEELTEHAATNGWLVQPDLTIS